MPFNLLPEDKHLATPGPAAPAGVAPASAGQPASAAPVPTGGYSALPLADRSMIRFAMKNILDSSDQGPQRAAFLKKVGLEADPKDAEHNHVRPIGSQGPYQPIDPSVSESYASGKGASGGLKGIAKGIGGVLADAPADATDVIGDTLVGGASAAAGAAGAVPGVAAGMVAGPVGGFSGGVIGAVLAGSAGAGVALAAKKALAEVISDEHVPVASLPTAIQALTQGISGPLAKGTLAMTAPALKSAIEAGKSGVLAAYKTFGAGAPPEVVEWAVRNWQKTGAKALQAARGTLSDAYNDFFPNGANELGDLTRPKDIKGGFFGRLLQPAVDVADEQVGRMSMNTAHDINGQQFEDIVAKNIGMLESKAARSALDPEETAALSKLKGLAKSLYTNKPASTILDAKGNPVDAGGMTPRNFNFGAAKEVVDALEDSLYSKSEKKAAPGADLLRKVAGEMNGLLKENATPEYVQAMDKQSAIFNAYKVARKNLTPTTIEDAYLKKDGVAKTALEKTFGAVDEVAGTNVSQSIKDGQFQQFVYNLYENPKNFGSGKALTNQLFISPAVEAASKVPFAGKALQFGMAAAGDPRVAIAAGRGLGMLQQGIDQAAVNPITSMAASMASSIGGLPNQTEQAIQQLTAPPPAATPAAPKSSFQLLPEDQHLSQ